MLDDYSIRAETLGLSPKSDVKKALSQPGVIFIDVRNEEELKTQGTIDLPFLHAPCTTEACPLLSENAKTMIPDEEAVVVVFCRSGRRAGKAKQVLEEKGYKHILNAGGIDDLKDTLGSDS
mmetsp:Transcript_28195/g.37519  ORF Transcript_28195/g.37519 Transcript_28195/m.37519 type:complete len:121 (+) Transcript_28195:47-409(+)